MGSNTSSFPSYFPEGCPPEEAAGENIVLYRICKGIVPMPEDFLTFYQTNPDKFRTYINAYGLSMFPSAKDCKDAKDKSPRLRQCKGVAYGQVTDKMGKILRTPNRNNPAHITWWLYEGVEPHTFFKAY